MSVTFIGGRPDIAPTKLANNSATNILNPDQRTSVYSIIATETNGGTHTLSIDLYDPDTTTSYFIRSPKALVAHEVVIFDQFLVVPGGWKLRATSGDASGYVDILVGYYLSDLTPGQ